MKILALLSVLFSTQSFAQVHVNGYTKSNGTYVAPHYRSAPNDTKSDNYSTRGNVNPYTGSIGTKSAYDSNSYKINSGSDNSLDD